jgi:hypothetical protein
MLMQVSFGRPRASGGEVALFLEHRRRFKMSDRGQVLHVEVCTPSGEWVAQLPVFGSVELAEADARHLGSVLGWRIVDANGKVHESWRPPLTINLTENAPIDDVLALFQRARGL